MRNVNTIAILLLCALALSSCTTPESLPAAPPQVVEVPGPRLAPPPADVMVKREANFRERLLNFFSASPEKPTTSPDSSTKPRP